MGQDDGHCKPACEERWRAAGPGRCCAARHHRRPTTSGGATHPTAAPAPSTSLAPTGIPRPQLRRHWTGSWVPADLHGFVQARVQAAGRWLLTPALQLRGSSLRLLAGGHLGRR